MFCPCKSCTYIILFNFHSISAALLHFTDEEFAGAREGSVCFPYRADQDSKQACEVVLNWGLLIMSAGIFGSHLRVSAAAF